MELFGNERQKLAKLIGTSVKIEHVGSTAVPGLGGKGIIDIAVVTDKEKMREVSLVLQKIGYIFSQNASTEERYFYHCDLPDKTEGMRRYHIHLMVENSSDCVFMFKFRDFLKKNPKQTMEYSDIKKKASEVSNEDGSVYREMKKPIIDKIIKKIEEGEKNNTIR